MPPAVKLVALIPRTELIQPKDHEVLSFLSNTLSRRDDRSRADHFEQLGNHCRDGLTARERDVLAMVSQGSSNKRIARALEISPETVKSHIKRIFSKLAVHTRAGAVFRAVSLDLL
jgi:ATP/maltotriose-dependent transcriptional regulator MalT